MDSNSTSYRGEPASLPKCTEPRGAAAAASLRLFRGFSGPVPHNLSARNLFADAPPPPPLRGSAKMAQAAPQVMGSAGGSTGCEPQEASGYEATGGASFAGFGRAGRTPTADPTPLARLRERSAPQGGSHYLSMARNEPRPPSLSGPVPHNLSSRNLLADLPLSPGPLRGSAEMAQAVPQVMGSACGSTGCEPQDAAGYEAREGSPVPECSPCATERIQGS
ncbi:hypothetical protein T484DRAFT_1768476 [Baffinella frigidus]|nr:hypothetical protein T484DRAFT_1768476 [Cryptophyta sp. CCMP2293]